MDSVFLVWANDYDPYIEEIYSTEEAAIAHVAVTGGHVEEHEVTTGLAPAAVKQYTVTLRHTGGLRFNYDEGGPGSCLPDWEHESRVEETFASDAPKQTKMDKHLPTDYRPDYMLGPPTLLTVTGTDPEKVFNRYLKELPEICETWANHFLWEYQHPFADVVIDGYDDLPSGATSSSGVVVGVSSSSQNRQRRLYGYDKRKRINYVGHWGPWRDV